MLFYSNIFMFVSVKSPRSNEEKGQISQRTRRGTLF